MTGKKRFFKVFKDDVVNGYFRGWNKCELHVWLVLKKHENLSGEAYPGIELMMELTGLSSQGVRDGIEGLEKRGIIEVERAHRKTNRYRFSAKN